MNEPNTSGMYRILTFDRARYIWAEDEHFDCDEDAIAHLPLTEPWRIQEWIDAGRLPGLPAEAGFWRDIHNWADGEGTVIRAEAEPCDEECDCADRSWYGPEHDTACPLEGSRQEEDKPPVSICDLDGGWPDCPNTKCPTHGEAATRWHAIRREIDDERDRARRHALEEEEKALYQQLSREAI